MEQTELEVWVTDLVDAIAILVLQYLEEDEGASQAVH